MKKQTILVSSFVLVLSLSGIVRAQSTAPSESPAKTGEAKPVNTASPRPQPAPVISPEVHPDRRVTFRLRAPNAKEVSVSGEWGKDKKAMSRDEEGLWSVTTEALEPDLYGYSFSVDGLQMLDPGNSSVKPMRSPRTSVLEVPGNSPSLHDFQPVPHGTVRIHSYQSKSLGKKRGLYVYTPPLYDQTTTRYPVLYLFHGSGDNEATWTALGRAHLILDNLLAQRKAKPMVIVMMDGHAAPPVSPTSGAAGTDMRSRNIEYFERDLLEDVVPFVESNYRVRNDRSERAIAGLSMGGGQSLTIGLNHLELFAWVGGFSSSVPNPETALTKVLADPQGTNGKLKLLWIACGKEDFLLKNNEQLTELLKTKGIEHAFLRTEGNHSWPVWRRYLAEFVPLLFTQKQ